MTAQEVLWTPGPEPVEAATVTAHARWLLQHASELRALSAWTWAGPTRETALIQRRLGALGVGPGDRVAAYMPNIPETLAASWPPTWNRPVDDQALADLVSTIRRAIREDCSPRHVPDGITSVARLPRTLSGKLLEVPVKHILMGEDPDRVVSRDSPADPEALDDFIALARQRLAETASDGS